MDLLDFSSPSPLAPSAHLYPRSGGGVHGSGDSRPPVYKAIGISLAISSGVFIGTSFVLKKMGLLKANVKYNEEAGEGYGYLKNAWWWSGMTLMIIGEICNFVAYAFVDAILVTPLGALSVVITTILSAIFLKERLSFVGKVGCFQCIIGSVVIVMNAPAQSSAANIGEMKDFMLAPGFLSYAGVIIIGCVCVAIWVAPKYGKKSMLVYLTICSLIGGLSVVSTQGLGAAIVTQAGGKAQFNQWFLYVLLVFVITTLITEIIYLNKALNIFNAALVTPTYYVYFTSATIITSAILFQGFKGTPTSIITVVLGFLVICSGVVLLQLSKSAKEVPDTAVFKGDLDQMRTVAEQEEPESEPKADAIRGTAAIIRRISNARQNMEAKEARRVHEEKMKEQAQLETLGENETYEWDGLRRRKTTMSSDHTGGSTSLRRQKTLHPPLGMTHFPPAEDDPQHPDSRDDRYDDDDRPLSSDVHGSSPNLFGHGHHRFLPSFRRRKDSLPSHTRTVHAAQPAAQNRAHLPQRPLTEIVLPGGKSELDVGVDTAYHSAAPGPGESTESLELTTRSGNAGERPSHRPIQWADDSNTATGRARGASSTSTLRPPPKSPGGISTVSSSSLAPTPPPHSGSGAGTKRQFSFQNVFGRHRASSTSQTDGPAPDTITTIHARDRSGTNEEDRLPRARLGIGSRDSERSYPGQDAATEEERLGLVKGDTKAEAESERESVEEGSGRSSEDMVVVREKGVGGGGGGYGGVRML